MRAGGLSRRQLLRRFGGGCAGWTLASVGLGIRPRSAAAAGSVSLRDLLRRISAQGCDPSHRIRAGLPNDHPYISLRNVAGRYAGRVVNYCQPLQITIQQTEVAGGGITANLIGVNFTGSGMAAIRFRSDYRPSDDFDFSVQAQPDGTFAHLINLGCVSPGVVSYTLRATDTATGRSADGGGAYVCPQSPPPPAPPANPSITVSRQGATFTVAGTGFLPSHQLLIRVVDPATFAGNYYNTNSDAAGKLSFSLGLPCPASRQLAFSASDSRSVPTSQDHTGMLWSNTVTLACS